MTHHKNFFVGMAVILGLAITIAMAGCTKPKAKKTADDELNQKLEQLVAAMQATKVPTKSNLTPLLAAQITHEVSVQSMSEFPKSQELPKDPKELAALNERIRQKNELIYTKYSTTMGETMRFISDLSPKDREAYNEKLTQLFLDQSKKDAGAPVGEQFEPAKPQGKAPAKKK